MTKAGHLRPNTCSSRRHTAPPFAGEGLPPGKAGTGAAEPERYAAGTGKFSLTMRPYKVSESVTVPTSRKIRALAVILTCLGASVALAVALEPFITLHWALAHPKSYASHDPHRWLVRLALLSIALALCQTLWQGARQSWGRLRAWQQAFLPMKSKRIGRQTEAEQPPA